MTTLDDCKDRGPDAEIARLRNACRIGRKYLADLIEDWGVDDANCAEMKADLQKIDAALAGEG